MTNTRTSKDKIQRKYHERHFSSGNFFAYGVHEFTTIVVEKQEQVPGTHKLEQWWPISQLRYD